MAWIESHQSLQRHPKTITAAAMLKISRMEMIGHLQCLWWWALDFAAPDGCLGRNVTPGMLADAAEFPVKKAETFINSLLNCGGNGSGFLEKREDIYYLHDWYDFAGKLIEQRALTLGEKRLGGQNRMKKLSPEERKELARQAAKARWANNETPSGCQQDASTHLAEMPATGPNSTGPTGPNHDNKESNKEKPLYILTLPDWLDKKTWDSFLEMRKKIKATPTERAKELLLSELDKLRLSGHDPTAVLNQSIMSSWKGVFKLDKSGGNNGRQDAKSQGRIRTTAADWGVGVSLTGE